MSSRFAALLSDSESDNEDVQVMTMSPKKGPVKASEYVQPATILTTMDDGEFCAVSKKKAHTMKSFSPNQLNKGAQYAAQTHDSATILGNGSYAAQQAASPQPAVAASREVEKKVAKSPEKQAVSAFKAAVETKQVKKGKKKNAGLFALLADSDEEEDGEDSDEEDSYEAIQQIQPVMPKQAGLMNTSTMPDYLAITHIESTREGEQKEARRQFRREVISMNVVFLNTRTKRQDHAFHRIVRPTNFPVLSQQTMETTTITQEKLEESDAQPLDEVLREFERWLKQKNLVSVQKSAKKGKASGSFSVNEQSFILVTNGSECIDQELKKEMESKKIQLSPMFKKWIDIQKLFSANYNLREKASLAEMLQSICQEWVGIPHVDDAQNICRIVSVVLGDCPAKLVANSS